LRIKQGDTIPITADLNANLAGAAVLCRIMHAPTGVFLLSGAATVTDASNGLVSFDLTAGNTAAAGAYFVEWVVTFGGGDVQRFPGSSYNEIVIDEAVPAA
jgi:hypothetical protein